VNALRHEYVLGELDLDQTCHCCGGSYDFNIDEETMHCTNTRCSAYQINFTIPYAKRNVPVRHRP